MCVFSNRCVDTSINFKFDNKVIPVDPNLRVLGVYLDSKLSLSYFCQSLVSNTAGVISLLGKCRKYLQLIDALHIYLTIIRPRLEYCSLLLTSIATQDSNLLEKCQNRAIRIILQAPYDFSMTTGRLMLNIHTLCSRRKFFLAKFIDYNITKKKLSHSLLNIINSHPCSQRELRNPCKLILPTPRTNYGKRTFIYNVIKRQKYKTQNAKELLSHQLVDH